MSSGALANCEMPLMAMKRNPQQKESRKFKSTSGSVVSALFSHAIPVTVQGWTIQTHFLQASFAVQNKVDSIKKKKIPQTQQKPTKNPKETKNPLPPTRKKPQTSKTLHAFLPNKSPNHQIQAQSQTVSFPLRYPNTEVPHTNSQVKPNNCLDSSQNEFLTASNFKFFTPDRAKSNPSSRPGQGK